MLIYYRNKTYGFILIPKIYSFKVNKETKKKTICKYIKLKKSYKNILVVSYFLFFNLFLFFLQEKLLVLVVVFSLEDLCWKSERPEWSLSISPTTKRKLNLFGRCLVESKSSRLTAMQTWHYLSSFDNLFSQVFTKSLFNTVLGNTRSCSCDSFRGLPKKRYC